MIFLTVGTCEYPFIRLIDEVIKLHDRGEIEDNIIIQSGVAKIKAKGIKTYSYLSPALMNKYYREARLVITHGGLASILEATAQNNNFPIVVPRQKVFGEHVNDHQVEYARLIEKEGFALVVYDIKRLVRAIKFHNRLSKRLRKKKVNLNDRRDLINKLIDFTDGDTL